MKLTEDIEYPCGCKIVDATKIYTSPQEKYSLQLCTKHRELIC